MSAGRRRATALLTCAALAAAAGAAPAAGGDDALGQLMAQLAAHTHGHAAFVERQFIGILDHPLESSGELFYTAPEHLEKRTLKPKPESLTLDHGELAVRRGARSYTLALRDYPQLAPFIDSIRATLAGDRAALERTYDLGFDARADGWTLTLVPRTAALKSLIASITIGGTADAVRSVEVRRADGDHSLLTISALDAP